MKEASKRNISAAVLDINIYEIPTSIEGLKGYQKAYVLIRVGQRPLGQLWIPVQNGRITRFVLLEHIRQFLGKDMWQGIVADRYLNWNGVEQTQELPSVTIAVITRDRPQHLRRCLDALMALPDNGQEYLVIDNCPETDKTRTVLATYGDRVRYILEEKIGASAARNRALHEAESEIVAFTDDDAYPDSGWLQALMRNFSDPLVLCATGLVLPFELETGAQYWFERYTPHGRGFTRTEFDCRHHDALAVASVGVSASMALRKSILEHVGGFEESLSPGTPCRAGEDYDLFSRILTSGYRIVYDPDAISWHRHRRSWQELRRTIFGYGIAVYAQWTHTLLTEHEFTIPRLALGWLLAGQLPSLFRSLLHIGDSMPLDLILAELAGCALGPLAYFQSRRLNAQFQRSQT